MTHASDTLSAALYELCGLALSSVEFVHDYIQLHFDGPTLTAFTLPSIRTADKTVAWGQEGYRDALCQQIGNVIEEAQFNDLDLSLVFQNGTAVSISVREVDYHGPEALQLSLDDQRTWVV